MHGTGVYTNKKAASTLSRLFVNTQQTFPRCSVVVILVQVRNTEEY